MDTYNRFRLFRTAKQLSQKQLAELLNVSQQMISSIESGKNSVSDDLYQRMKSYFPGDDIDYVTGRSGMPDVPINGTAATAHDLIPFIGRMQQQDIANNIHDSGFIYRQPRIVKEVQANADYLAVEMADDTMVNDTPLSIAPGDAMIGVLVKSSIAANKRAYFAIAKGLNIVCGLLTKSSETEIELTPANNIYPPVCIKSHSLIRLYRVIELHTSRHSL